jgi:hypothetical protein
LFHCPPSFSALTGLPSSFCISSLISSWLFFTLVLGPVSVTNFVYRLSLLFFLTVGIHLTLFLLRSLSWQSPLFPPLIDLTYPSVPSIDLQRPFDTLASPSSTIPYRHHAFLEARSSSRYAPDRRHCRQGRGVYHRCREVQGYRRQAF